MRRWLWGVKISAGTDWSLHRFRVRFDGILLKRDEKHLGKVAVLVVLESSLLQLFL